MKQKQEIILNSINLLIIIFLGVGMMYLNDALRWTNDTDSISGVHPLGVISFLIVLLSLYGLIKLKTKTYYFVANLVFFQIPLATSFFIKNSDPFKPNILRAFFVTTLVFVVLGVFLNYRRTGNFFKEADAL